MSGHIDLNADLGERYGAWSLGNDEALLDIVTSANLACGFHAGDPLVMRRTLRAAQARGVSVGAHPSYPDREGFGRRAMALAADELEAVVIYQIGALQALAAAEGLRLTHVKPHGALSNAACADRAVADVIARALAALDRELILLAPARSPLAAAGRARGLAVREEVFADRAYQPDGQLVPRSHPDALLRGAPAARDHVMRMIDAQALIALDGTRLPTRIDSVCVHGDNAEAIAVAAEVRRALETAGYTLASLAPAHHGAGA